MRVPDQARHVVDAAERDIGGREFPRQRRDIHRGEGGCDLAVGFWADFHAVGDRGKARIGGKRRIAHHVLARMRHSRSFWIEIRYRRHPGS